MIFAELEPGVDNRAVRDDIEAEVGKIDTFPEQTKTPQYVELKEQDQVIKVAVYGNQPERTLKETAEQVRDDLLAIPRQFRRSRFWARATTKSPLKSPSRPCAATA